MISGPLDRRRLALALSTIASVALHAVLAVALLFFMLQIVVREKQGAKEQVSEATIVTIQPTPAPTPVPTPTPTPPPIRISRTKPVQGHAAPAAAPARHELAHEVPSAPPQPPPPKHPTAQSRLAIDERAYANEVAQLHAQDDPHAIPTIDPGTQAPAMKTFSFRAPPGMGSNSEGNGLITPTEHWRDHGADCYYGRYSFTYPSGAEESADIAWPFCYPPGTSPFFQPPHAIAFPYPVAGYKLPPGITLPPQELETYQRWLATGAHN